MRFTKNQKEILRLAEEKMEFYRDSEDPDIKFLLENGLIVVSHHSNMYSKQIMVRAYLTKNNEKNIN